MFATIGGSSLAFAVLPLQPTAFEPKVQADRNRVAGRLAE